jgi:hypothetical protein
VDRCHDPASRTDKWAIVSIVTYWLAILEKDVGIVEPVVVMKC